MMQPLHDLPLFGGGPARDGPRQHATDHRYPATPGTKERGGASAEAAKLIKPSADRLRADVLRLFNDHPERTWTADEAATALEKHPLAVRPRFSELGNIGAIVKTDRRRPNDSGLSATVWSLPSAST